VNEGKPGGTLARSSEDQSRDLDDLPITPGGGSCVSLRAGDVRLRRGGVALVPCDHGEEGMRDRVHRHVRRVRLEADVRLTGH
jgi:hypothetical protein